MSVKEAIQLICPRVLKYSKKMRAISKPLSHLQIDGVVYSVFQDLPSNKRVRTRFFYSDASLLETYMEYTPKLDDNAYSETKPFPFHRNTFYNYFDDGYSIKNDKIIQITKDYGIKNTIVVCNRNNHNKTTENFFFYTNCDKPNWFVEQVANLPLLNKFSVYLKGETQDFIHTPQLSQYEMESLFPNNDNGNDETLAKRNLETEASFEINEYHFGYPFIKPLSIREFEVIKRYFLAKAASNIANELHLSKRTIEKIIENIRLKTECTSLKELKQAMFECPNFYRLILNM